MSAIEKLSSVQPPQTRGTPSPSSADPLEIEIIKERLTRLEDKVDKKRPGIRFPNPSIEEVWERVEEVESASCRLADDCLGAMQSVNHKLESMESSMAEKTSAELEHFTSELNEKLTEGIEKIAMVLRKLVAVQKKLLSNQSSRSRSTEKMPPIAADDRKRLVEELQEEIEFLERAGY
jgi:uncharacterized coiled-coil protein SlyX